MASKSPAGRRSSRLSGLCRACTLQHSQCSFTDSWCRDLRQILLAAAALPCGGVAKAKAGVAVAQPLVVTARSRAALRLSCCVRQAASGALRDEVEQAAGARLDSRRALKLLQQALTGEGLLMEASATIGGARIPLHGLPLVNNRSRSNQKKRSFCQDARLLAQSRQISRPYRALGRGQFG